MRQKILDLEYQMTLFPEETKGPLSRLWQSHLGKGLWLTEARRGKVEMSFLYCSNGCIALGWRTENNPANGSSFSFKRLKVSLDLDFGDHNLRLTSLTLNVS